jgi:hypothetical protein
MGCDHRREPPDESPAGTRDFGRLYASLPEEAEAIGWYEQRAAIEIDFKRPPPMGQAGSDSFKPLSMALEIAILSFAGVNSAAEAFAAARERSSAGASWPREVGFVEHHADGHLVLRGTFAGHYVDVDEALHVSERGAAEGWAAGAAIGALLGPLGFAVGLVAGGAIGSQLAKPSESDPEPQPLSDRLRIAVPRSGSAIVLIAEAPTSTNCSRPPVRAAHMHFGKLSLRARPPLSGRRWMLRLRPRPDRRGKARRQRKQPKPLLATGPLHDEHPDPHRVSLNP